MRKALWSTAALVVLLAGTSFVWGPSVQAADPIAMGSSSEPLKFLPAELAVQVGETVTWVNNTDFQHDVVAEDGSFKSRLLNKGEKYEFKFTKAGDFKYFCTPHESAGMTGVIKVGGGATSPTTIASTTTTTAAGGATPPPPAAGGATTTTTSKAAAGASTTTTTAGLGVTSTTQAPSVTPTSAPEAGGVTSTTAAAGVEAAAGDDHASSGGSEHKDQKSSPLGIAFAGISTVLLAAISGKLLASKS